MGPEDQAGHDLSGEFWKGKDKSNAIAQQRNGKDYVQVGSNGRRSTSRAGWCSWRWVRAKSCGAKPTAS
jgi:hypothetical protein